MFRASTTGRCASRIIATPCAASRSSVSARVRSSRSRPTSSWSPSCSQRRDQAYRIAPICTIASRARRHARLRHRLFPARKRRRSWLIRVYGMGDKIAQFQEMYGRWGAAIILAKGLTPIPFKLVTIASGIAHFNFALFVLTATITRALRFFLIAFLLKRYGQPVQDFIEKRLTLLGTAFADPAGRRVRGGNLPIGLQARPRAAISPINPKAMDGLRRTRNGERRRTHGLQTGRSTVAKTTPLEFIRQVRAETAKVVWPTPPRDDHDRRHGDDHDHAARRSSSSASIRCSTRSSSSLLSLAK